MVTTAYGGAHNQGTVFELSPSAGSWEEKVLFSFSLPEAVAAYPEGGLIFDKNGNLFGNTGYGVFELQPSGDSWPYSVISTSVGGNANLAIDYAGNLYGTDLSGSHGRVWEFFPHLGHGQLLCSMPLPTEPTAVT